MVSFRTLAQNLMGMVDKSQDLKTTSDLVTQTRKEADSFQELANQQLHGKQSLYRRNFQRRTQQRRQQDLRHQQQLHAQNTNRERLALAKAHKNGEHEKSHGAEHEHGHVDHHEAEHAHAHAEHHHEAELPDGQHEGGGQEQHGQSHDEGHEQGGQQHHDDQHQQNSKSQGKGLGIGAVGAKKPRIRTDAEQAEGLDRGQVYSTTRKQKLDHVVFKALSEDEVVAMRAYKTEMAKQSALRFQLSQMRMKHFPVIAEQDAEWRALFPHGGTATTMVAQEQAQHRQIQAKTWEALRVSHRVARQGLGHYSILAMSTPKFAHPAFIQASSPKVARLAASA